VTISGSEYSLAAGGGDYTLAPGETHNVSVSFSPATLGDHAGTIDVGVGDMTVILEGYASWWATYRYSAASLNSGAVITNYGPFSRGGVDVTPGSGVTWDADSWMDCNPGSPRWDFNGNSTTESAVAFEFDVPNGASEVKISFSDISVEHDCVQLLIEVDGVERTWENLEGHCDQRAFTVPLSSGIRTIRIGTDQSALCSPNMALWDIHFQFNVIVQESQHGSWTD